MTLSMVPQNAMTHKVRESERAMLSKLVSRYNAGTLQAHDALVGIGVIAGMRQFRTSLEHEMLKNVEQTHEGDNE